eukprot:jgi/Tetstr1/455759/TSEL_042558.t1
MAPKKNEPAKDKEDKDDATPGRLKYRKQSRSLSSSRSPSQSRSLKQSLLSRSPSQSRSLKQSPLSPSPSLSMSLKLSLLSMSQSRSRNRSRSPSQSPSLSMSPLGLSKSRSLNRSRRLQRRLPGKRPVMQPLVLEPLLPRLREGFLNSAIDIDDLANIDKDFQNALPYVDTFAVPPALNGFGNTGAVDWIFYGHLKVEIADPEVKTSHGGDINMLYADRVNLVIDKDTCLPHIR